MTIPNLITLGRIVLVPVVFWLLVSGRVRLAFFAFLLAGISDAVDGFLAKRYRWQTELGAYLDPLADKLLIVCVFVALGVLGELPSWIVITVVSRDILIVMAVLVSWLMGHPLHMKPLVISKANTAAQIVLAAFVLASAPPASAAARGSRLACGAAFRLIWPAAVLIVFQMGWAS